MKFLLFLLTAGLLCNLWPFSNRHMQRNAPTFVPQTTMEKLEAHVWTAFPGKISEYTSYNDGSTFFLFKNNIMYSRRYNYDGTWEAVVSEPFYFYTPGVEDKTDTLLFDGETYQLFNYDRIGQAQNGKHIVYDYAYAATGGSHRINYSTGPRRWDVIIWDSIITSPPTTGFANSVKSVDIMVLNDGFLVTKGNTDFTDGRESVSGYCLHATGKPFPWDENLKKYYRKMPVIERPPYLGVSNSFIHL